MGLRFFFQTSACASCFQLWGIFIFGRGKTNFLAGGGVTSKLAIASDHPVAYASMPHPVFGAKDVCYIETKVAK